MTPTFPKRPRRDLPLWVVEYQHGGKTYVTVMHANNAQEARGAFIQQNPHVKVVNVT